MDRLVFYLSSSGPADAAFAGRVTRELQRLAATVAVLPDPDSPERSGVAWLGGCDAVLVLLTRAGVSGSPSRAAELARAAELGRPVIVVREHAALPVPVDAPVLTLPDPVPDADREAFRQQVAVLCSPAGAIAEQHRALAAWQRTKAGRVDPRIPDTIGREIALHEARQAAGVRAGRVERERVRARLGELAARDLEQAGRHSGTGVAGHLPDQSGVLAGLDDVAHAVVTGLATDGRTLLTLNGGPGIGKTAVAGELPALLGAVAGENVPVLYVSAYGNAPLTGTMLLNALAAVADAATDGDATGSLVRDSPLAWVAKFDLVLEALGTRPVVLVVDDADQLFEVADGSVRTRRFLDPGIRGMLRGTLARDRHRLRWLLAGRDLPDLRPLERRRGQVGAVRLGGLPLGDGVELLRSLDPDGRYGLRDGSEQHLHRLHQLTAGRPRALELVSGVLRTDPAATVPGILALLDGHAGDPEAVLERLFDLVLDGLGRAHRRVVQALAAFAEPVAPTWVDMVLTDVLPGYPSDEALRLLTEIRVVRRYGDRFALPRSECRRALVRLPRGTPRSPQLAPRPGSLTETLLYGRAAACAQVYLDLLGRTPATVEDLEPELRLIRLLIRTGRLDAAISRMDVLEGEYLEDWGQSHVLIPARHELLGRLTHRRQAEASNRSRLAAAYTQLGEHEQAGRILEPIDALLEPGADTATEEHRLRLRLQHAGNLFDRGSVGEATRAYRSACTAISAEDMPDERVQGHNGLMLCLSEEGLFDLALAEYDKADHLVHTRPVDPRVRAELRLNVASFLPYVDRSAEAHRIVDELAESAGTDVRIAAKCETARATLAIDADTYDLACGFAGRALAVSGIRQQLEIFREAHNRLALAQVCAGNLPAAREAAQAAVRTPESRRALETFALRGLIAFREDDAATAVAALQTAAARAHHLVVREARNFALLDWYGLVVCLLAHYEEEDLSLAVDIYRRAREITRARSAVGRSARLLRQVERGPVDRGFLDTALAAARGVA